MLVRMQGRLKIHTKCASYLDVVLWDSHPLALGATPIQVFIDGISQLANASTITKPASLQKAPKTPDFDQEREEAIKYEGLPPLTPLRSRGEVVMFTNITNIWERTVDGSVVNTFKIAQTTKPAVAVVENGHIVCHGVASCASYMVSDIDHVVDLQGGSLQPGLVTVGSGLGLQEIAMESSTVNGEGYNRLLSDPPSLARDLPRAVDGLAFGTRDAL